MIPVNQMIHNHFSPSRSDSGGQTGYFGGILTRVSLRTPMQEVVERMRRVSEDLREIRKRLEEVCKAESADARVLEEVLKLDLIREFKNSIDQIRLFLWSYFQAAVDKYESGPDDRTLQEFRLRRAIELLRGIQEEISMPMTPAQLEVKSLFERLQNLADITVEKHMATKEDNGR